MLFNWYRELGSDQKKTFLAATAGWTLDAFDFLIYTFVIGALIKLWGISSFQGGAVITVTAVTAAIGGMCAGLLADRYGRVRVLQWTIIWFTIATCLIGFTTNYYQLLILRALQGFGFGGEWAIGAVLISEAVKTSHRGRAVGTMQSGWAIGWMAAAFGYALATSFLPLEYAWRALFWVSVIPAVLVFFIRRHVKEPEVYVKAAHTAQHRSFISRLSDIFSPCLLKVTILAALLSTGIQGAYYAIVTFLPKFLEKQYGLNIIKSLPHFSILIGGAFLGYLIGAYLTDKGGRRLNLILFSIFSGISVFAYTRIQFSPGVLMFVGFPLGFCACGLFSSIGAYLSELYPSSVRATGQGFAYNFGRLVGALFPTMVGLMADFNVPLGDAICIFAVGAYALVLVSVFFLPETKNLQSLADIDEVDAKKLQSTVVN